MKAAIHRRYGPPEVLRVEEIPAPRPGPGEVQLRIHASTVTSGDARLRGARVQPVYWLPLRLAFGLRGPRRPIPGMEFAGEVTAIGAGVTRFAPGQAVFGITLRGANAEYLVLRENAAATPIPPGITFAKAAATPFGALAALAYLRDVARVQPGEHVLVVGAAGCVGVFAVQLARHMGARVTALCSPENAALVRELGAEAVLERGADATAGAARYDVVLDTVGFTRFAAWRPALAPGGRHAFLTFGVRELWQMAWTALRGGPRVRCGFVANDPAALEHIAALLGAGIIRPVIGRRFRLEEIVEAHHHVDGGRKRGSAVLSLLDADPRAPPMEACREAVTFPWLTRLGNSPVS